MAPAHADFGTLIILPKTKAPERILGLLKAGDH
jgi:hypothetical protein